MAHAVNDLEATVFEVIHSTASNRSSMLQDVEAGRPTEIDFITGWLVRQANHHGVATPQNAELLESVRKHGS
jgi:2-dehydropantoate 2-reductase